MSIRAALVRRLADGAALPVDEKERAMPKSPSCTGPGHSEEAPPADVPVRSGARCIASAILAALDVGLGCAVGFGFDWIADAWRAAIDRSDAPVVPADHGRSR